MGFPKVPQLSAQLLALAHFRALLLWASQLFLFPGALRRAGPTDPADTQRTTCTVQNKRLSFHPPEAHSSGADIVGSPSACEHYSCVTLDS